MFPKADPVFWQYEALGWVYFSHNKNFCIISLLCVEKYQERPAEPAISCRRDAKSIKEPEQTKILTEDATELWAWPVARQEAYCECSLF